MPSSSYDSDVFDSDSDVFDYDSDVFESATKLYHAELVNMHCARFEKSKAAAGESESSAVVPDDMGREIASNLPSEVEGPPFPRRFLELAEAERRKKELRRYEAEAARFVDFYVEKFQQHFIVPMMRTSRTMSVDFSLDLGYFGGVIPSCCPWLSEEKRQLKSMIIQRLRVLGYQVDWRRGRRKCFDSVGVPAVVYEGEDQPAQTKRETDNMHTTNSSPTVAGSGTCLAGIWACFSGLDRDAAVRHVTGSDRDAGVRRVGESDREAGWQSGDVAGVEDGHEYSQRCGYYLTRKTHVWEVRVSWSS